MTTTQAILVGNEWLVSEGVAIETCMDRMDIEEKKNANNLRVRRNITADVYSRLNRMQDQAYEMAQTFNRFRLGCATTYAQKWETRNLRKTCDDQAEEIRNLKEWNRKLEERMDAIEAKIGCVAEYDVLPLGDVFDDMDF